MALGVQLVCCDVGPFPGGAGRGRQGCTCTPSHTCCLQFRTSFLWDRAFGAVKDSEDSEVVSGRWELGTLTDQVC